MRNFRTSNTVPFIGTFTSLIGLVCGVAGLALTIFTFWKGVDTLGNRIEGLSVSWGPAIYMVGVGCLALLIDFACFVISLFSDTRDDGYNRETYRMFDYNGASDDSKPMNQTYAISTPNHQNTFDNNYSSYPDQTAYGSQAGYKDQRYY
jgi:hypothetical protein